LRPLYRGTYAPIVNHLSGAVERLKVAELSRLTCLNPDANVFHDHLVATRGAVRYSVADIFHDTHLSLRKIIFLGRVGKDRLHQQKIAILKGRAMQTTPVSRVKLN
jgi:hypothetical protein